MPTIYHIDSSARVHGSRSRELTAELVAQLAARHGARVSYRDIAQGLEFLTPDTVDGLYIDTEMHTAVQRQALRLSDQLVGELEAADIVVIGAPMYNLGPAACLKAWADLVARKGLTFTYTEHGPMGLLDGKQAYVVVTSDGVPVGSPAEYLSGWLTSFLAFLGISEVTLLAADQLVTQADQSLTRVRDQINMIGASPVRYAGAPGEVAAASV